MTRAFSQHKASGRFARESRPIPSHRQQNAARRSRREMRLIFAHRTVVLRRLFLPRRKETSARVPRTSTLPSQAEPSRARYLRSRACARARGFEESHAELRACMHAYINASVPVAFLMLQRDADGSVAWSKRRHEITGERCGPLVAVPRCTHNPPLMLRAMDRGTARSFSYR